VRANCFQLQIQRYPPVVPRHSPLLASRFVTYSRRVPTSALAFPAPRTPVSGTPVIAGCRFDVAPILPTAGLIPEKVRAAPRVGRSTAAAAPVKHCPSAQGRHDCIEIVSDAERSALPRRIHPKGFPMAEAEAASERELRDTETSRVSAPLLEWRQEGGKRGRKERESLPKTRTLQRRVREADESRCRF
jgi:hypothetical protein